MSRIFFSAGESSGDIHGANVIRALRAADPSAHCEGLGGQRMESAGMTLHFDLAGHHVMGFSEVLRALKAIRRVLIDTGERLKQSPPDCLVLIDNPDFNLRLAEYAYQAGVPVVYYISPQVWAWRKGRIKTIARLVRKMLVILPFEEALYREAGVDCTFVGHPLLDHVPACDEASGAEAGRGNVVALLPGSRQQEIARLMPVLLETARGILAAHPEVRFMVPCVSEERERQVLAMAGNFPLETLVGQTHEVLRAARLCLVASGTATLETALFGVPMIIVYKTAAVNYWIARSLVEISHIGLVNILAGRGIVPEFIQGAACVEQILPAALELYNATPRRAQMLADLNQLRAAMGAPGASERAAREILDVMRGSSNG